MNDLKKTIICVALLLAFLILNGIALARWVKQDIRPPAWDESIHIQNALDYQTRFHRDGWRGLLKPAYFNYPPFYHLTLGLAFGRTERLEDAGAIVNFFYLAILVFCVFFIGQRLIGPWEGLTASLIVIAYPMMIEMTRPPMIDLALTSLVALSFLFLLLSDHFGNPFWSAAFGVGFALSMLTKWTAFIYLGAPFLVEVYRAVRQRSWLGLGIGMAAALVVMGPWYAYNGIRVAIRTKELASLVPASGAVEGRWANALWYMVRLPQQMGIPFLILFVPGLAGMVWRPKLWPVFLWLTVSLLLLTLMHNKNTRYSLPAMPAAALLSVAWLPNLRRIPVFATGVFASWVFYATHFMPTAWGALYTNPPEPGDWQHEAIFKRMHELKPPNLGFARAIIVSNAPHFHSNSLNISRNARHIKDFEFRSPSKRRWTEFSRFILFKTGDVGPDFSTEYAQWLEKPPSWFRRVYKERGRWPLPDGSQAVLLQCEPEPHPKVDAGFFNLSFKMLELPRITARQATLKAIPFSPTETQTGRFKEVIFESGSIDYKSVSCENIKIELIKPQINIPLFLETNEIQLLDLDAMRMSVSLSSSSLIGLLSKKAPWLKNPDVRFEGRLISLSGTAYKIPIHIQASVWVESMALKTRAERFRLAGIPFPLIFLRALTDREVSLKPNVEMPFFLDIKSIEGNGPMFRIVS